MRSEKISKGMAAMAIGAMLSAQMAAPIAWAKSNGSGGGDPETATPIKHVIVLIGENRTFDHTFATYQPKNGESVANLLAKGIVNPDGSPGPNSAAATQFKVNTPLPSAYFISVDASGKTAYSTLPTPELSGAPNHAINLTELNADPTGVQPPFDNTISDAQLETLEPSLESEDLELLRTGATGAAGTTGLDSRGHQRDEPSEYGV